MLHCNKFHILTKNFWGDGRYVSVVPEEMGGVTETHISDIKLTPHPTIDL